jgi:hypothetical protein
VRLTTDDLLAACAFLAALVLLREGFIWALIGAPNGSYVRGDHWKDRSFPCGV